MAMTVPERCDDDAEHFAQLETGARWLAGRASDEAERHEHLAMAGKYARLRIEAGLAAPR
jgi:hypothetical protein